MPEQAAEGLRGDTTVAGPFRVTSRSPVRPVSSATTRTVRLTSAKPVQLKPTQSVKLASATAGAARPSAPSGSRASAPVAATRSRVTVRGALVAMVGLFLLCSLAAGWLNLSIITGLGYTAGCVLAPCVVSRRALLHVVAAPPALFLVTVLVTQVLTAQGSGKHGMALSVLEGTALTLAAAAPWLLAGTALGVGVAIRKGLIGSFRQLRADLRS